MANGVKMIMSKRDAALLSASVSMMLARSEDELDDWDNKNDDDLDDLYNLMEIKIRLGDLWVRLHEAMGFEREDIQRYLANPDDERE
jgi:hypothetical protein